MAGTNTAETRSARRWTGAFPDCEQRLVDSRLALDHHAVGRNLLPGPYDYEIAERHPLDRYGQLVAVP
jgi:hypothetical protein